MEKRRFINCCMPQCHGLKFDIAHKFPRKSNRLQVWLDALDNQISADKALFLCGRHFRPQDYVHAEARTLNFVAVPSLNIKDLSELHLCRQVKTATETSLKQITAKQTIETTGLETSSLVLADTIKEKEAEEVKEKRRKLDDNSDDNHDHDCSFNTEAAKEESTLEALDESIEAENDNISEHNSSSSSQFEISFNERTLDIANSDNTDLISLDSLWLRQQCRCEDCYDPATHTKKHGLMQLDKGILPELIVQFTEKIEQKKKLQIKWSDGHTSRYNIPELYETFAHTGNNLNQFLWITEHTTASEDFTPGPYHDLLIGPQKIHSAVDRLQRLGVLVFDRVSTDSQQRSLAIKLIISSLFPHLQQNVHTETRADFPHTHTIPHTNSTFESVDCGLQILSLNTNSIVTSISLVDAFQVAAQLRLQLYATFEALTELNQTIIHRSNEGFEWASESRSPLIQLQNKCVERVNFAPYHWNARTQANLPKYFDDALQKFTELMSGKERGWNFAFKADMLVILDNWRICWKLEDFSENNEENEISPSLDCVYVARKHYLSRLHSIDNLRA